MSNDLKPYEKWMKDQLKDVDVPDMNQAWEQMSNLLQPAITNVPTAPHKPWFGKWWIAGSVIAVVTTVVLFTKNSFKNNAQKQHIKTNITNNSKLITQNNQNNIEPVNNSIQNKWSDTLNSKTKEEQDQQKNISLKNKIEIENKVSIKDKSLASTINSKNKLVVVNKEEEKRNIIQNKKYKENISGLSEKKGSDNTYTKLNNNTPKTKSTSITSNNNTSKSPTKKFRDKKQLNSTKQNAKKNYSTSNINKDKKSIKSKSTDNNTILNASNKLLAKETNAEKQLKNIQYNINTFTPTAVLLPNPTIINTNQQLSTLLSKQLASSNFKRWSARVGLTLNKSIIVGGQTDKPLAFNGKEQLLLNYIPSLHFNLKYQFNLKWSVSFSPHLYVPQLIKFNTLDQTVVPILSDPGATKTTSIFLDKMYYSHFPLSVNYNITKRWEIQSGIDPTILHNAVAYEEITYYKPAVYFRREYPSISLRNTEAYKLLQHFDVRFMIGAIYNLNKNLHLGLQYAQAFTSYLNKPTSSPKHTSLNLLLKYDLDFLKKKNKKAELQKNTHSNELTTTATIPSKQTSTSKKWSARVGATINAPFAIGGREYNDHTFTSRDGSIINFIPSLHFNIKYAITPKWSIGFAPQFFVQQVPYSNALSAIIKAPVPADSGATLTTVVRLANMYYSHFPLTINYNLSKKFEVQAGIDLAILNKVVAYKNEKYESPTRTSFSPENSTSLTQEELQTLHKFDIRALFGITYTLGNSLHFGLQFTQAFGSYLKQKLAPALSSDPAAGISDPLPTKSTNASFQLFTRYDFNILKRKSKKDEVVNNTNQKQFNESKSIQTDSVKAKKWSIRVGLTLNVPIPIGAQTFDPISPYYKQAPLGGTVHKWTLNFIPWPHVDFRYKLNPKWSIELGIQPSVQQLAANNIVYRKVSSSAPGDTSISIIRLSKMFYFRMPLSINYSINKKFEIQAGIDPGILHTPLGYYETRSYRTLPPTYDLTNKYPTVVWPEYDVLRRIEVKAKLGAIYNVNNKLHCGVSFSQAFNFYVERPDQQLAPIFPSDPAPVYRKNFALNLFFKYDLDLLKKKNKQKKN